MDFRFSENNGNIERKALMIQGIVFRHFKRQISGCAPCFQKTSTCHDLAI